MKSKTTLTSLAVGLADLNASGIDGPLAAEHDSRMLALENNPDIFAALAVGGLARAQSEEIRQRLLGWLDFQIQFIRARKIIFFTEELPLFPEHLRRPVAGFFPHYDDSVAHMQKLQQHCAKLDTRALLAYFGFLIA